VSDDGALLARYEVTAAVARVTLDRPADGTGLTVAATLGLLDVLHAAAADSAVRCVVVTGSGTGLRRGLDLADHAGDDAAALVAATAAQHQVVQAVATMPKPVVAAMDGPASGFGVGLALAADLRVLARSATLDLTGPPGVSCTAGLSWTLPRLVGHGRATDLLMRPRVLDAGEAHAVGLATEVVDDHAFAAHVDLLAASLATGPTLAIAATKRALAFSAVHDLSSSLEHEAQKAALTARSRAHRAAGG
jgi:2-(1,2-epoxy-1,2-dihydrophenyl)acetyl-CoA isomerase